jgi:hypothetical protein
VSEPGPDPQRTQDSEVFGAQPQVGTNTLAVLAFAFSIALAPLGIVLGILGLRQTKQRGQAGRGFALAGLCIGGCLTLVGVTAAVAIAAVRPQAEARVERPPAAPPSASQDADASSGDTQVSLACQEIVPAMRNTATQLQHDLYVNDVVAQTNGQMNQINTVARNTSDTSFQADVAAVGMTLSVAVDQISTTGSPDLTAVQDAIKQVIADCAPYVSLPAGTQPLAESTQGTPPPSETVPVSVVPIAVSVLFEIEDWDTAMNDCVGVGQYSDLHPGTSVTIRGPDGAVLGSSSLGQGLPGTGGGCSWVVSFAEVPADTAPLEVQVGQREVAPLTPSNSPWSAYNFQASLGG